MQIDWFPICTCFEILNEDVCASSFALQEIIHLDHVPANIGKLMIRLHSSTPFHLLCYIDHARPYMLDGDRVIRKQLRCTCTHLGLRIVEVEHKNECTCCSHSE